MYSTLPLSPNKLKPASLYLVLMISSLVVANLYPRQLKFLMLPLLKQLTPWPLWTTFTQAPLPKTKLRINLNNNPNSRLSSPLWTSISANLQHKLNPKPRESILSLSLEWDSNNSLKLNNNTELSLSTNSSQCSSSSNLLPSTLSLLLVVRLDSTQPLNNLPSNSWLLNLNLKANRIRTIKLTLTLGSLEFDLW